MAFQLKYNFIQGFMMFSVINTALSELNVNSIFKTPSNDSKSPWIWTMSIYEIDDASLPETLKPPLQAPGLDEPKVKFITHVNETHASETWLKTWVIYWLDGIVEVEAKFVRGIVDESDTSNSISMPTDQEGSSKSQHYLARIQSNGRDEAKNVFALLANVETRINNLSGITFRDVKNDPLTLIMTSKDSVMTTIIPHTTPNDFIFNPDTIPDGVTIIFEGLDDVTTEVPKINLLARNETKDDMLSVRLLDVPNTRNITIIFEDSEETGMQNASTENAVTSKTRNEISDRGTAIFEDSNSTSKDLVEIPENVTIIFEDMGDNRVMNLTEKDFTEVPNLTVNSEAIDESVLLNISAVKTTTSGSWDIPDDVTIIFEDLDEMADNISKTEHQLTKPLNNFRNPENVTIIFKGLDQEVINAKEGSVINEGFPEDVTIIFEDGSVLKIVNQTEESSGKIATTVTDLFVGRLDTTPIPTTVVPYFGLLNTLTRNHAEPPTTMTTPLPPSFESLSTNKTIEDPIKPRSVFGHSFESTVNPVLEKPIANPVLENPTANPVLEKTTTNPVLEKSIAIPVLENPTTDPVLKKPTANPVLEKTITIPVLEKPTANPVLEKPTANPVLEKPTANPVLEKPTANPVLEKPTANPVLEKPTANPVLEKTITIPVLEKPTANPVLEKPTANPVLEKPTANPVLEKPTANPVLEKPKANPVLKIPTANPVLEKPIANPVLEKPTANPVLEKPTSNLVVEHPPGNMEPGRFPANPIHEPPSASHVTEQTSPNSVLVRHSGDLPPPATYRVLEQPTPAAYRVLEQPPPAAYRVLEQPPPAAYKVLEQPPPAAYRVLEQPPPPAAYRVLEQPLPAAYRLLEQPPVANRVLEQPPQAISVYEQPPAGNRVLQQPPTDDLLSGNTALNKPTLNIEINKPRKSFFPDPVQSMVVKTLERPLGPNRLNQLVEGQPRMTRLSVNGNTQPRQLSPEPIGHRSIRLRHCRAARDCDDYKNERCLMGICDCGRKYLRDFRSGRCLENFFSGSYAGRIPIPYRLVYLKN